MSDSAEVNVDAADVDIEEYNKQNPDFAPEIVDAEPNPADVVDLDEEADA